MEGENVANCEESENNDNKTECISIDDVSNSSDEEKIVEKSLEKAPLIITLEPNKKLSKIFERHENDNESVKEIEIKVDDEKKVLDSITPEELEKLRKIFGPNFTMDNEIEKPESALGFIPSHMKVPDDTDYVKNKFKNL